MLAWDGTAEPVSRDQILGRERGRGNVHFPCCSADHDNNLDCQFGNLNNSVDLYFTIYNKMIGAWFVRFVAENAGRG